jgi:hypothetical protein
MQDIRVVSLAVFAASFLLGFMIFESTKVPDASKDYNLQLSMVPLFTYTK